MAGIESDISYESSIAEVPNLLRTRIASPQKKKKKKKKKKRDNLPDEEAIPL